MSRPQSIGEILPKVITKLGLAQKVKEVELLRDWPKIVGEAVASHCHPVTLDKGYLTINVDSSPWLSQLERYYKQKILEKVQKQLGKRAVRRIRFRIGDINADKR